MRILLLVAAIVTMLIISGCGGGTPTTKLAGPSPAISTAPAVTKQLFRGGPDSGSLIGQTIPDVPGISLKLYNYSTMGFGTELSANSMAARYEATEGTWFAPSVGQTRGGPSNKANVYCIQVENGRDYNPQPEATSDTSYKLLPGDYIVWCSLYWNGQSIDVGTPLRVNIDPNRAILLVEPTKDGNTVSVMVSNAKPGTVANGIVVKVDVTSTPGQIVCTASADNANTVSKNLTYEGIGCSVVQGTTFISEKLQGRGGDGIIWNRPDDLAAGVFLNSLAGDDIRIVKFDIRFTPTNPPATAALKAYYGDGSEVYLRPDGVYAIATDPLGADCWITFKASGVAGSYRIVSENGSVTNANMTTNVRYWSWGQHKVSLTDANSTEKAAIQVLTFDGSGKGFVRK